MLPVSLAKDLASRGEIIISEHTYRYVAGRVAISVPVGLVASLILALLLNQKLRTVPLFRALFYLPSVVPTVAGALIWLWILNPQYGIINQAQYSSLVATVIASAVIPTVIANAFYLPRHLFPSSRLEETQIETSERPGALVTSDQAE